MSSIEVGGISRAIEDMLEEYADLTFEVTDKALDAGTKVLIKNLKAASPKGTTGEFAKSWKKKKSYKLRRYVGNTKMVEGQKGEVPLSNILEYSAVRGKPFIKRTYDNSINEIANAIIGEVKKG